MTKTATLTPILAPDKPTDLRVAFDFHAVPFTREIATDHHLRLPFLDEALAGLFSALARMSVAISAPAGTGKTALLRRLRSGLPEAHGHAHDVAVPGLSRRDRRHEIAVACGDALPIDSAPLAHHERKLR